ncbi:MAG: hypothetical protein ABIP20_16570 [Chthoniobacteraceae bacterium]
MKHLLFTTILSFLLVSPNGSSSGQDITTAELARHLGISTWRIPKEKLPATYVVLLYHVTNGALTKEYRIGKFTKAGDLLICTQRLSASVSISASDGNTIVAARSAISTIPVFTVDNKFEGVGVPLLLCYGDENQSPTIEGRHKETTDKARAMNVARVSHGLAIVVTDPTRDSQNPAKQ